MSYALYDVDSLHDFENSPTFNVAAHSLRAR
jgi:hypothetical protein